MNILKLSLALFATCFVGLVVVFREAVSPFPDLGFPLACVWWVWFVAATILLLPIAQEITLLIVWLILRLFRCIRLVCNIPDCPVVPTTLARDGQHPSPDSSRRTQPPSLAIIMPAHTEATTPKDQALLCDRICNLIDHSPDQVHFFALFDSPPNQERNERAVISEARERYHPSDEISVPRFDPKGRIHFREYRNKPKKLRHKCGSTLLWLQEFGDEFEYFFVVDADSTLPIPRPESPETCDGLLRMLEAMENDSDLAMVQAINQCRGYSTLWAWNQNVDAEVGLRYYAPLYATIYGTQAPCYGHNVLFRTVDFEKYCCNTIEYLSHDLIDSSDLAAAGRKCIWAPNVVAHEEPEETLVSYLKRELRWARGNAQWVVYLLSKRRLALGPTVFLGIGIAHFVFPLLFLFLLVTTIILRVHGVTLIPLHARTWDHFLLGAVAVGLFAPKVLGAVSFKALVGNLAIGIFVSPAVTVYRGLFYLVAGFHQSWTISRSSRSLESHWSDVYEECVMFWWTSLAGTVLWVGGHASLDKGIGDVLIRLILLALVASPLSAFFCSIPILRRSSASTGVVVNHDIAMTNHRSSVPRFADKERAQKN